MNPNLTGNKKTLFHGCADYVLAGSLNTLMLSSACLSIQVIVGIGFCLNKSDFSHHGTVTHFLSLIQYETLSILCWSDLTNY